MLYLKKFGTYALNWMTMGLPSFLGVGSNSMGSIGSEPTNKTWLDWLLILLKWSVLIFVVIYAVQLVRGKAKLRLPSFLR